MAKQLNFLTLGNEMKGIKTTEGFDVLTSYSDPITDEDVELDVFMTLDHPLIQFEDGHGNITLKFDIQKARYDVIGHIRTTTLPSGMVLSFKTTLSNVTGTVDSSQSKGGFAGKGAKAAPANETKASVDLIGTTDESRKAVKGKTFMLDALKQYFQENAELKYFVASVSNQYDPQLGSHSLQPRSFCFNTLKGKTKDDESALCMWISVKEGTNKDQSSKGNFRGTFYDRGLIPIPRGRTCSLILDNDLLTKQYLMPGLSKYFNDFKAIASSNGKSRGKLIASDVDIEKYDLEYDSGGLYPSHKTHHVDGIKFSPSEPETTISFDSGLNSKSHKINYTSDRQRVNWEWRESGVHRPVMISSGTTNREFVWTAKGSWKDKKTAEHPNLLRFDWTSDKEWTIKKSAEDVGWWEKIFGGSTAIPEHLRNLKVPSPNVKLEMNTLDYFLTRNLLYPGKHIFNADDPSSASTDKGLALPRDLILTGETKIN
ncbi:hypothetical protein AWENTII_007342 [Aspergillus wentii]